MAAYGDIRGTFGPPANNIAEALTGGPIRRGLEVKEGVDGNWKCMQCGNINFGTREQCNRCTADKPQDDVLQQRWEDLAAGRKPMPVEGVEGNWACMQCTTVNWWQRETCKRCSGNRPPDEIIEARRLELQQNPAAPLPKPTQTMSNWRCCNCTNINWSQRINCSKCGAANGEILGPDAQRNSPGMGVMGGVPGPVPPPTGAPGHPGAPRGAAQGGAAQGPTDRALQAQVDEIKHRQAQLEAQMATMQATLLPQISSLSAALQQVQTHLIGLHAQVSAQLLASLGVAAPALPGDEGEEGPQGPQQQAATCSAAEANGPEGNGPNKRKAEAEAEGDEAKRPAVA